jgi:hypothetical protein
LWSPCVCVCLVIHIIKPKLQHKWESNDLPQSISCLACPHHRIPNKNNGVLSLKNRNWPLLWNRQQRTDNFWGGGGGNVIYSLKELTLSYNAHIHVNAWMNEQTYHLSIKVLTTVLTLSEKSKKDAKRNYVARISFC